LTDSDPRVLSICREAESRCKSTGTEGSRSSSQGVGSCPTSRRKKHHQQVPIVLTYDFHDSKDGVIVNIIGFMKLYTYLRKDITSCIWFRSYHVKLWEQILCRKYVSAKINYSKWLIETSCIAKSTRACILSLRLRSDLCLSQLEMQLDVKIFTEWARGLTEPPTDPPNASQSVRHSCHINFGVSLTPSNLASTFAVTPLFHTSIIHSNTPFPDLRITKLKI